MRQALFICLAAALVSTGGYLLSSQQPRPPASAAVGVPIAAIGDIFSRH